MPDPKEYEHEIAIDTPVGDAEGVEVDLNWKPPPKDADGDDDLVETAGSDADDVAAAAAAAGGAAPGAVAEEEPAAAPPRRAAPDPEVLELRRTVAQMQATQAQRDAQGAKAYNEYEDKQIEAKLAGARERHKKALKDGDDEAATAAVEEMTDLKVEKKAREIVRAQPAPQVQQQQPPAQGNPLTQQWKQKNPWFGAKGFGAETLAMRGIDSDMVDEGYDPNTEEYFDEMSRRLKDKMPKLAVVGLKKDPAAPPRAPNPPPRVAPAGGSKTPVVQNGKVRLDKEDFKVMRMTGLDPDSKTDRLAYAKEKVRYAE